MAKMKTKRPTKSEIIVEETRKRVRAETILELLDMKSRGLTLEQAIEELKERSGLDHTEKE